MDEPRTIPPRPPVVQQRMFDDEVRRSGSPFLARRLVLPPAESSHDRLYDNEWWHVEHRPDRRGVPPRRLPHPGVHHLFEKG
ncbi:hypothetical protein [Nonomuraea sp. NPDC001831]|uniref:hypothetical protein n=1 Tax=Nonomuraea sp. NPDC001831 TaxID=3364340 RepID=UPI00368DD9BC